jgi:GNAT superfamily N-acetyltransferase
MDIHVRPLSEADLDQADRIFRLAFGTFIGLPDPRTFGGDSEYVRGRWRATPDGAFAAIGGKELVGSNFATRWGSFGFFGPLTVRPDIWDRGIARRLLEPTMAVFDRWGTTHRGLFTFSQSAKHHALYQKFGFHPRFLTYVASKPVAVADSAASRVSTMFTLDEASRERMLGECRGVTDSLYPGLDLTDEIRSTAANRLGDTILLDDGDRLDGFAVCHLGKGTEAGSGNCYVKFGAVRRGAGAARAFERLLDACEAFAAEYGATRLVAGVNLAREGAYRTLLARGFRAIIVGVAMQSGNAAAFNVPDVWALDDWR